MIKPCWKKYNLGAICDFQGGSQPPKGEWRKSPERGYVRMLQIRDFTKSRDFDIEYVRLSNKLRLCEKDDILIGRYGASVGKILTGLSGAYNVALIKATPDESIVIKPFIRRVFEAPGFQAFLANVSTQRTAQAGFSKEDIADYDVSLPPLQEQQRIVDILDREFSKIDALKANAEKSLQAAKDLFQATLKKELEPKEGWKKKRLEEICKITAELIDPTLPEYIDQIHIGGANIIAETGVLIDLKTSREENLISGKFPFDETMVLYSKIRPYLKKVCCPDFQGICSADIYPLKPNQDVDRTYLYYILLSQDFTDYAILGSARAGMPKVNRPYMFAYSCSIPEYEEQRKVANRLDAVREQTYSLQDNYKKTLSLCDDLKQSLLHKAFNGEL